MSVEVTASVYGPGAVPKVKHRKSIKYDTKNKAKSTTPKSVKATVPVQPDFFEDQLQKIKDEIRKVKQYFNPDEEVPGWVTLSTLDIVRDAFKLMFWEQFKNDGLLEIRTYENNSRWPYIPLLKVAPGFDTVELKFSQPLQPFVQDFLNFIGATAAMSNIKVHVYESSMNGVKTMKNGFSVSTVNLTIRGKQINT